ncbi:GTP 3',8-cyclase MoaA [Pendulispora rubella]|uniref:GTP 3',8-cyclase MoaA n=1 Tax=Pendulispora rubella TaxID=2741070 RepID=UPI0030E2BD41
MTTSFHLPIAPAAQTERAQPRAVRLSLTDRCDLACLYCRPNRHDGYLERRLDLDAWATMAAGLVRAGVRRVRLTGGEPLLHRDVVQVIERLAALPLEDLALTTNATRLAKLARPLRDAGLRRITVSLDTLDAERFARLTRGGHLDTVLEGIDAACAAGFDEVKLNAVVLRGENDEELPDLLRYSWDRGIVPRFLEVMLIGEGATMRDRVVPAAEMRERLAEWLVDETPVRETDRGPARYVRARHDARLKVGFISGTSDTYCKGCDRLRVSSDGTLRPCLATNDGLSAEDAARAGDAILIDTLVHEAWKMKPDGETFRGCTEESAATVSIRAIGG